jgi:hypothetical protein
MRDIPEKLINRVQDYTNAPWWNGQAYAELKGYPQQIRKADVAMGTAVDDIANVVDWLRDEKQYAKADILRRIAGDLARAMQDNDDPTLQRHDAKGWK